MKLSAARDVLLKPLQAVIGVVERRQTMPILSNVLLVAKDNGLAVTATDLEVELVAEAEVAVEVGGEITVSGRKLLDICRALPEGSDIDISVSGEKVTHFSMAQQDVRYYLNGMLLETGGKHLRAVATDGHRLALCEAELEGSVEEQQVIVPRKGVLELQRLMTGEGSLNIELGPNHVRIQLDGIRFTSKLIDGRFPEYDRVIPKESSNQLTAERGAFKSALQRTAILSNEKYRGIRLIIRDSGVVMQAHNPEQEEAEEELEVEYSGEDIEIGFNVNYLLDALAAVDGDEVTLSVLDGNSSCLIRQPGKDDSKFVVMPMRL